MPTSKWAELLLFTFTCKYLTYLDLSRNAIGEAGHYLAQSITSWGDNPPLQYLYLHHCSMPEQVWNELLQSLSSCKHLSYLDMSENSIGRAGYYLPKLIKSLGDNCQLIKLFLEHCSIPIDVWAELLQSLFCCKQLSNLNLSGNSIGEASRHLVKFISSLKCLHFNHCSIPEPVWVELLQSLSYSTRLYYLDIGGNVIGDAGQYLAQSITSLGDNPALEWLDLTDCSISKHIWLQVFHSLSSCSRLETLDLSVNTLTGCLSSFLSDPYPGLTSLGWLYLKQTTLNKPDIQHLNHLIQTKKLSHLQIQVGHG